jgi:hypothetical protein
MDTVLSLAGLAIEDDAEQGLLSYVMISCGLTSDISDHC